MIPEKEKRGRIGQQGFTLLELMISLVLMGLVVLITAGAMRLGFRSAESGQRKIESVERLRTSLNILESQIQSAFIVKKPADADIDFAQLKGDRSSIEFRSLYSWLGGTKGPVFVKYEVKEGPTGGRALYVTENPIFIPEAKKEALLIENARDLFFEYFQKGPTDEKGKWADDWTDKDTVPYRIRITITTDAKVLALILPLRMGITNQQITSVTGPAPNPVPASAP
ncbi:MAG TPA: prepilin-type N-terminal cleavage/methylation domain-containing protein [Dissulfurispiraceae bacterium]|nr:prepilin-type N-terminal cleavage/methylation domain-containing protein [Dissulfurispiraceae bacterium]